MWPSWASRNSCGGWKRHCTNGLRLVQLREKDYSREALRALALKMLPLMRQHDARLIINADIELAKEIGADGVQLTGAQLAELHERPDVEWCASFLSQRGGVAPRRSNWVAISRC